MYQSSHSFLLQRNTNFYSCTQMAIRFFTVKYEFLQLYPNGHSFFYSEIRNFTVVSKRPFVFYSEIQSFTVVSKWPSFFTAKCKILKTVPNRPFVFHSEIRNLELYPNCHSFFDYKIRNF